MQRIMVDLPEPDGPQITMRSPRSTVRLISRSTWNSPYHLCMPMISTARAFEVWGATAAAWLMETSQSLVGLGCGLTVVGLAKPRFDAFGVARHREAEDEVEYGGECIAGRAGRRRRPFRINA